MKNHWLDLSEQRRKRQEKIDRYKKQIKDIVDKALKKGKTHG